MPKLTYANVTATLALFLALGGSSYAVIDDAPGANTAQASCSDSHDRNCSNMTLDGRSFTNRDLTRSIWDGASLKGASFRGSDLYGSSFDRANLSDANLSHGNRTQSNFKNANMQKADLTSGDFWGTDLENADLRGARFDGTKFDRTDLTGANLRGATIKNSSFLDAHLCHTIQPDGSTRDDDCEGSGTIPR